MKPETDSELRPFFEPRSVAILGSLRELAGEAFAVVHNMLQWGYEGDIYPINPSYSEVLGIKAYPTVNDVEGPIDLAMVITPPATLAGIIRQCAEKGIRAVIIGTEGFAETGEAGAKHQRELVDLARSLGIRLLGPNTIGTLNAYNGLTTNQYLIGYNTIRKGNIAYSSQTGFVGAQGQPLEDRAYPISKMCDFGNKCDVDEADLLDYLLSDPETDVIGMHLEDIKRGRRFMDALRKTAAHKPVVILKAGRTGPGAIASASHTGSLAGSEQVHDTVFRQCGAVRVRTWQEFWDVPKLFAYQPLPKGNRIAMTTPTGGVGVVAVDAAVDVGLSIAQLSQPSIDKLARLSTKLGKNPIDLGPTMVLTDAPMSLYEEIVGIMLDDIDVDCAIIVLYAGMIGSDADTIDMMDRLRRRISKPVTVWIYGTKVDKRERVSRLLEEMGLPTYLDLETAIRALGLAAEYARYRSRLGDQAQV